MNKQQVLAMAQAEFERWEALLSGLSEAELLATVLDGGWSIKDVLAHLKAWQELSMMRLEAGQYGAEPVRPNWPQELDLETESNVDETNAWIYAQHRAMPWASLYNVWRCGYLRFLALGALIPEEALLKKIRYAWTDGYSLADSLVNSAKHHQEHREILLAQLDRNAEN
ncbi:MAG: ClbS/DfsB family four-helix bundle protein [Anaerolineaceae bacterium]|nr:ClbS/DfsB family four-helix bundle protein [Anaerolineaceae bacterium]